MNWSEKAQEIADKICTEDALAKMDVESYIIYDDDGRLELRYLLDAILPMVRKAAIEGMKFECDNWLC